MRGWSCTNFQSRCAFGGRSTRVTKQAPTGAHHNSQKTLISCHTAQCGVADCVVYTLTLLTQPRFLATILGQRLTADNLWPDQLLVAAPPTWRSCFIHAVMVINSPYLYGGYLNWVGENAIL